MRGLGFFSFGVLATGIHLGAFHMMAPQGGTQSGGNQGADQVTLAAAAPQLQAMVQRWEQMPEIAEALPASMAAPSTTAQPALAQRVLPAPVALPSLPDVGRIDVPQDQALDTAPASAPPPPQQPKPKPAAQAPEVKAPAPKPAPAKPTASAAAPKKQASGTGTTTRKSTGGTVAAQSVSKAQIASLQARWNAQINRKIKRNQRYPRGSKDTGTAKVALTLSRDGRLKGLSLLRSSGSAALDQAALKAVKSAGRFAKAPKGLSDPLYKFAISLKFSK